MPKEMLTCRVCGKKYEACTTKIPGVYRWKDIACSRECYMKWVSAIEESRAKNKNE